MRRIKTMFGVMSAAVALSSLLSVSMAQGPGRPGGFRGGPGGFGGFGRGGGNIYGLLDNAAVQEDLKLTEEQKSGLPKAKEKADKLRQESFAAFRGNRGNRNGGQPGAGGAAAQPANGQGGAATQPAGGQAGAAGQAAGGAGGRRRNGGGGQAGGGANGGGGQAAGGAIPNFDPAQFQAQMQQMRTNMAKMQKQTDAIYAEVLKKDQVERLRQIDLRRQGQLAVLRPEIASKIGITDMQQEKIQAAQQEINAEMRESMPDIRQAMAGVLQNEDGSRVSREERQKRMEEPAVKSQMESMRRTSTQLMATAQKATIKAVSRELTKKQKDKFNALLGKPFDLTKLTNDRGPGSGGPPAAGAAAAADATKADAATEKTSAKSSTSKKKATTRKGTRKSSN